MRFDFTYNYKMKLSQKIAIGYKRSQLQLITLISPQKAAQKAFTLFCTPRRKPSQNMPPVFKKAEKLSVKVNGLTIRGYRWNHAAAKKILIVHGFESSCRNFDGFIVPLAKKGYEIIAFDAPAHGQSEGTQVTLPVYVQMLQAVYNEYGPFDGYIAHSFGGLAISHLLEVIPHTNLVKTVLIAPATETTSAIDGLFHFLHLNKKVRVAFDELVKTKSAVPPESISIRRAAKNIKADTLWFHDKDDDITPFRDAEKVKNDAHPNMKFVITNGLGHRKIYRDNTVINQVLAFL